MTQLKDYPNYYINAYGDLFSTYTGTPKRLSKLVINQMMGYQAYYLKKGSEKRKMRTVHRLVYETYKGEIPQGKVIDHIDSDVTNNHISNLRVVSQSENTKKRNYTQYRIAVKIQNIITGEIHEFNSRTKAANYIKEFLDINSSIHTIADRIKATTDTDKLIYKNFKHLKSTEV